MRRSAAEEPRMTVNELIDLLMEMRRQVPYVGKLPVYVRVLDVELIDDMCRAVDAYTDHDPTEDELAVFIQGEAI